MCYTHIYMLARGLPQKYVQKYFFVLWYFTDMHPINQHRDEPYVFFSFCCFVTGCLFGGITLRSLGASVIAAMILFFFTMILNKSFSMGNKKEDWMYGILYSVCGLSPIAISVYMWHYLIPR